MKNTIYFAGTMVQNTLNSPKEFGFVHCSGSSLPYLTTSIRGLKHTAHHANLYALSDDNTTATLADDRGSIETPTAVILTDLQRALIEQAISVNFFFS